MKLKMTIEIDVSDVKSMREALEDALLTTRWTFCNQGSKNDLSSLCSRMRLFGDDRAEAQDSGTLGWEANVLINE